MVTLTPSSKKRTAKKPQLRSRPTSHLTGVDRRARLQGLGLRLQGYGLCMELGGQGSGPSSLFWSERSWSLAQSHPDLLPFSNYRTLWNPYEEAERDPGMDMHRTSFRALLPLRGMRTSKHKFTCSLIYLRLLSACGEAMVWALHLC